MSESDFEPDFEDDGGSDFEPDIGDVVEEEYVPEDDFATPPPKKKARKSKKASPGTPQSTTSSKGKSKSKAKAKKSPSKSKAKSPSSSAKSSKASKSKASKSKAKAGAGAGAGAGSKSKKGKVVAVSEKNAAGVLLDYLNTQNKPYSAVNVYDNLHKAVKRAHVNRVLDKLADEGKIQRKVYKKFKLFYPVQSQYGEITQDSVAALETEAKELDTKKKQVEADRKALEHKKGQLSAALTDDALDAELARLEEKVAMLGSRVETITSAGKQVDPAEKEKMKANFMKYRKAWATRRNMVMEIVERMSEGMDKKPKVVVGMLGLETDEECGVSLKECRI